MKAAKPRFLCDTPTQNGLCWRLRDHQGKHVNQQYLVASDRPLVAVSHDGVAVAMYQSFQISAAEQYIRHSGGHVVDVRTWEVKA